MRKFEKFMILFFSVIFPVFILSFVLIAVFCIYEKEKGIKCSLKCTSITCNDLVMECD